MHPILLKVAASTFSETHESVEIHEQSEPGTSLLISILVKCDNLCFHNGLIFNIPIEIHSIHTSGEFELFAVFNDKVGRKCLHGSFCRLL